MKGSILRATACAVAIAAFVPHARAQREEPDERAPSDGLHAGEAEVVARALEALGEQGDREAVRAIADRIDEGLPSALLLDAIDALVATEQRVAARVLAGLAQHRRAAVRARVARGLAALRSPLARRVLSDLLDDPSPEVRAAAAEAVGELGARPVMDTLAVAAGRGVAEATLVVGEQARPPHVRRLLRELDAGSVPALAPALRILLRRNDLPRRVKTQVVSRLQEIGGTDAERLLLEVAASLRAGDPVRKAAEEAVEQMQGVDEQGSEDAR